MHEFISTETSQTAIACEQAALFGATPGPDEFDNREIWNEDEALAGIEEAIHILAGTVAPDGTQLADERESLLWGFVNTLHAQVQRLDRGIDKIAPEMKDLGQEQDGFEIKSRELELLTDRVQNLGDRRDAFDGTDRCCTALRASSRLAMKHSSDPKPPSSGHRRRRPHHGLYGSASCTQSMTSAVGCTPRMPVTKCRLAMLWAV